MCAPDGSLLTVITLSVSLFSYLRLQDIHVFAFDDFAQGALHYPMCVAAQIVCQELAFDVTFHTPYFLILASL